MSEGDAEAQHDAQGSTGRDETPAEKMDRNWDELLQELRVTQTGVQILSGFLLTLPFRQRFTRLDQFQRGVYLTAVLLAAAATGVGRTAALAAAGGVLLLFLVVWVLVPLSMLRAARRRQGG